MSTDATSSSGTGLPGSTPAEGDEAAELIVARLREAHAALLARTTQAASEGRTVPADEIRGFMGRLRESGRTVVRPSQRRTLQQILGYWQRELAATASPSVADYEAGNLFPAEDGQATETAASAGENESWRERVRLAATARQWRETRQQGYLLNGDALEAAKKLADDPDIADLVRASEKASAQRVRQMRVVGGLCLSLILLVLTAGLILLLHQNSELSRQNNELLAARIKLEIANEKLDAARNTLEVTVGELSVARDAIQAKNDTLEDEIKDKEMTAANANMRREQDAAIFTIRIGELTDFIVRKTLDGAIEYEELPDEVKTAAAGLVRQRTMQSQPVITASPAGSENKSALERYADRTIESSESTFNGYDPGFLAVEVPLPVAPGSPRLLQYLNSAIALDEGRRMPVFAAANFYRDQAVVVPAAADISLDPRLPPEVQPDPAWFRDGNDPLLLIEVADIAWGRELAANPIVAADRIARSVFVWPNALPVRAGGESVWADLSASVRTAHNPTAPWMTIMNGPIFPENGGGAEPVLPVAFWKVALSTRPSRLVDWPILVEAFIVPAGLRDERFDPRLLPRSGH